MNRIAVFKSRAQALNVYRYLQSKKIACVTISTPSKYKLGCGISIVFSDSVLPYVQQAIGALGADSFYGFFYK